MRISPINVNSVRSKLNTVRKQNNVSFGIINPKDREKIRNLIGFSEIDDENERSEIMKELDHAKGLEVKLGSPDNPRGTVYADIIPEEVQKSSGRNIYKRIQRKSHLDHLEDKEKFADFYMDFYDAYRLENRISYPSSESSLPSIVQQEQEERDWWYVMDGITH